MRATLINVVQSLQRYFLLVLLACYALAALIPAPGALLATHSFEVGPVSGSTQTLLLMIALFASGLGIGFPSRRKKSDERCAAEHPPKIDARWKAFLSAHGCFLALRIMWLIAAVLLFIATRGHWITFGLLFVLSMPAAISSVPWTHKLRGNVSLTLSLIVTSLLSAPLILAATLFVLASVDSTNFAASEDHGATTQLMAAPIIQLVLFAPPVLLGLLIGRFLPEAMRLRVDSLIRVVPTLVILLLNYCNASRVFPTLETDDAQMSLMTAIAATAATALLVMFAGGQASKRIRLNEKNRVAVVFANGMYNTGMAMVILADWFPQRPELLIPILLYTVAQHVFASVQGSSRMHATSRDYGRCARTMTTSPVSINEP